jgi:putative NIF3 family GTP cyclohydrolase 1 type 2
MPVLTDLVLSADQYLRIAECGDWSNALNGLQVENSGRVTKIGAAVDASTRTFEAAAREEVDLLVVHHGLFWPGVQPITGPLRRQIAFLFEHDIALYSAHLPLDVHPLIGNNAQLAGALGLEKTEPFLEAKGQLVGLKASGHILRDDLVARLEHSLGGPVKSFLTGRRSRNVSESSPAARDRKSILSRVKASIRSSPAKRRIGPLSLPKSST